MAPRNPVEKLSKHRTLLFSRSTTVPPLVTWATGRWCARTPLAPTTSLRPPCRVVLTGTRQQREMGIAGMAASSSNQSRAQQQQRQRLHDPREVSLEHQRAFSACRLFAVEESLVIIHSYPNYSILSLLVDSKTLYKAFETFFLRRDFV
jgi:hypothetical protein